MKTLKIFFFVLLITSVQLVSAEVFPRNYLYEVSKGNIPGHSILYLSGYDDDVDTTKNAIWSQNALYVYPTSAIPMNVSSSSAQDKPAGTGAYNITIFGLDADYKQINETVTLNGQIAVPTTNSYFRINKMNVNYAGSSETNVGDIYIGTGTPVAGVLPVIYYIISANKGESSVAVFTIPDDHTAFLYYLHIGTDTSKIIQFSMDVRCLESLTNQAWRTVYYDQFSVVGQTHNLPIPFKITEKCDVKFAARNSVGDAFCSIEVFILLIDNDYLETSFGDTSYTNSAILYILAIIVVLLAIGIGTGRFR